MPQWCTVNDGDHTKQEELFKLRDQDGLKVENGYQIYNRTVTIQMYVRFKMGIRRSRSL